MTSVGGASVGAAGGASVGVAAGPPQADSNNIATMLRTTNVQIFLFISYFSFVNIFENRVIITTWRLVPVR
jgi:hypothetical protein